MPSPAGHRTSLTWCRTSKYPPILQGAVLAEHTWARPVPITAAALAFGLVTATATASPALAEGPGRRGSATTTA